MKNWPVHHSSTVVRNENTYFGGDQVPIEFFLCQRVFYEFQKILRETKVVSKPRRAGDFFKGHFIRIDNYSMQDIKWRDAYTSIEI